jgi:DNA-binding MarR family transcriptional regulator
MLTGPAQADVRNLTRFRYAIRKLLCISEAAAHQVGLTPQHHQILLAVAGFTGRGSATIGELAEFLQVRHHSAVGLVDRAQALGLVRREPSADDRRQVEVALTADGLRKLRALAPQHRKELNGMRRSLDLLDIEEKRAARRRKRLPAKPQRSRATI